MTRELNGRELQQFIKVRQLRQVRNLRQEHGIAPKLLIVMSKTASDVIAAYVRMKQRYARDILIDVEIAAVEQSDMISTVQQANDDASIQGISTLYFRAQQHRRLIGFWRAMVSIWRAR